MAYTIPGKSKPIENSDPISENTPNFTWGEALRDGTRLPINWRITANIIKTAEFLQGLRDDVFEGRPVTVTSWLRVPYRSRGSQHYQGLAVDIFVHGLSPAEVYRRLDALPELYNQGLGKYNGHTHFDLRGYRARWTGISQ